MCRAAPTPKGLITAAVGCAGGAIGVLFLASLLMVGMLEPSFFTVVGWLFQATLFIAFAMFALFLGAVGRHFGDHSLPKMATFFVVFEGAYQVWTILTFYVIRPTSSEMAMLVMVVTLLCAFGSYGWLLYLTNRALVLLRRTQTQWGRP